MKFRVNVKAEGEYFNAGDECPKALEKQMLALGLLEEKSEEPKPEQEKPKKKSKKSEG